MLTTLALFCLAIVVVSLLGGLLPLATVLTHTRLQLYLSFSAGAMLGAAFFHMMPEAVRLGSAGTLRWAAAGLLGAVLPRAVLRLPPPRGARPTRPSPARRTRTSTRHGRGHSAGLVDPSAPGAAGRRPRGRRCTGGRRRSGWRCTRWPAASRWPAPSAADRAVRGGLGAAAWGVFLATVVHKPADALTIVSLMLRAGRPAGRWPTWSTSGSPLMIPLGVGALLSSGVGRLGPGGRRRRSPPPRWRSRPGRSSASR